MTPTPGEEAFPEPIVTPVPGEPDPTVTPEPETPEVSVTPTPSDDFTDEPVGSEKGTGEVGVPKYNPSERSVTFNIMGTKEFTYYVAAFQIGIDEKTVNPNSTRARQPTRLLPTQRNL
ncbi:hypothetical protein [Blautia sp. 1033sp1_1033st1_G9_1033SCRN_220408]|uniref:hypothetical protein n=1 Tax=Blautia sp. 1033sp1_1033st1_G9_1033SCRN_220408 TaxID=3144490 RepID=UPI0034A4AE9C